MVQHFTKTNIPGFVKDKTTNLIINTDEAQYRSLVAAREKSRTIKLMEKRLDRLENELEKLKAKLNV